MVALSSCNLFTYTRPFADEYYDSNYIANIGFDQFVGADTAVPSASSPVTGKWDFTYRYESWDQFPYMTLEKVTDSGYETAGAPGYSGAALPGGLSSSAAVYRLELKNLVVGGDFEASGYDPYASGWTVTTNSSSQAASVTAISSGAINGTSLYFTFAKDTSASYALVPVTGQFVKGKQYSLDFRWLYESSTWPNEQGVTINGDPVAFNTDTNHATKQFSVGSSVPDLVFKPDSITRLTIDDVSVKKTGNMQLRLLLTPSDTTPELGPFLYRFTFWVHADPSVKALTSPYHLDVLSPNMLPVAGNSTMSTKSYGDYAYASSSGWTKMTVEVENGNLQFPDATKPVLELVIDLNSSLPGRVLLAQPELYAYPDGY